MSHVNQGQGKAYCQHLDLELSALRTVKKKLLMVTQGSGPVTLKIYMTDVGSALKGILETLLYRRVQTLIYSLTESS